MSADLAVLPAAGALEEDPVQYMAIVLNRAKSWLAEAQNIETVRETKALAVGYESVIREKELAFDAQLSATEIVRRCERRIGELVREGQRDGRVLTRGERLSDVHGDEQVLRPSEAMGIGANSKAAISQHYSMADVPNEQFETAITEAREEGNLSRANVVRKVKSDREILADRTAALRGERKQAPASLDTERGRQQAAAAARRFTDLTSCLAGYAEGVKSLDIPRIRAAMEPAELDEWIRSLGDSLTKLRRFRTDLQEGN